MRWALGVGCGVGCYKRLRGGMLPVTSGERCVCVCGSRRVALSHHEKLSAQRPRAPVVFGEPEEQEADILHSCRLHAALTGVRRAAGAPSRCAEVTRARGHTRGILDDIFDRSILYLRIVCTQTTRKRAHS